MGIKMNHIHIENCGTGINATGKVDMDIKDITLKSNHKDMDFFVDDKSKITIDQLISTGCKTTSLTYQEYSGGINDSKCFIVNSGRFSKKEIESYLPLLDKLNSVKDSPSLVKKILNDIYEVGKGTTAGLLLAYIKMKMHWQ